MICFAFRMLSHARHEMKSALICRLFLSFVKFICARAVCRFWRRTLLSFFAYSIFGQVDLLMCCFSILELLSFRVDLGSAES